MATAALSRPDIFQFRRVSIIHGSYKHLKETYFTFIIYKIVKQGLYSIFVFFLSQELSKPSPLALLAATCSRIGQPGSVHEYIDCHGKVYNAVQPESYHINSSYPERNFPLTPPADAAPHFNPFQECYMASSPSSHSPRGFSFSHGISPSKSSMAFTHPPCSPVRSCPVASSRQPSMPGFGCSAASFKSQCSDVNSLPWWSVDPSKTIPRASMPTSVHPGLSPAGHVMPSSHFTALPLHPATSTTLHVPSAFTAQSPSQMYSLGPQLTQTRRCRRLLRII